MARVENGKVTDGRSDLGGTLEEVLERLRPGQYFCKPDDGAKGTGVFRLDVGDSGTAVDGIPRPFPEIVELFSSSAYLIQASLVPRQHRGIARFNDGVINTIRLMVFGTETAPFAAAAMVRLSNGAVVDNWSKGGVAVPVDLARGVLGRSGVVKGSFAGVDVHGRSGIRFVDQPIPCLDQAIAVTCALHSKLPIKTLGWDVAILEDGPCILEANRPWDVHVALRIIPGFLSTFLDYHLPAPAEATRRLTLLGTFDDRNHLRLWLASVLGRSLTSGRVDEVSEQRLTLTVTGSAAGVDAVIYRLKKSAARFSVHHLTVSRATDVSRRGLDLDATFLVAQTA
jgi:hypothetical protein